VPICEQFCRKLPQYNRNIVMKNPFSINSNIEFVKFAIKGLLLIFIHGYQLKGWVVVTNIMHKAMKLL
jgi:hypothetical protein